MIENIFALIILVDTSNSYHAKVGQYKDVTLEDCGLLRKPFKICTTTEVSTKITPNPNSYTHKCFRHRKQIKSLSRREIQTRISGGYKAKLGENPWMAFISVKLSSDRDSSCGGALINHKWVLTAAHCLTKVKSVNDISIRIGSTDKTSGGIILSVEKYFLHPKYTQLQTDLALIKVNERIDINVSENLNTINSICLPEKYIKNYNNEKSNFSGWGRVSDSERTDHLMSAELEINNYEVDYLLKRGMRAETNKYKICKGDSGSPLVQFHNNRAVVIGILTSHDNKDKICSIKYSFFARISQYIEWVLSTVKSNS